MDDMENLPYHRKYRPNTLTGYIGNHKLKETAMKALSSGKRPQAILLWGDSGCGKAQPLDSLVLTTDGFKRMGNIQVGDEVFTHKGNRGRISGIYPQGKRPIYRITLSDRTYIDVSDEHLNLVWTSHTEGFCEAEDYEDPAIVGIDEVDVPDIEPIVLTTLDLIERYKIEVLFIRRHEDIDDLFIKPFDIYDDNILVDVDARIVSVERIEDKECQCIMVDHPDHTYISDFFIPTHNTTFARLLAKEYSCENRDDTMGACNGCISCQTINDYIATGKTDVVTNIQEINIADQSGKRDLDAVLDDMQLPSYGGEWKIYIFDECHEATSGLQNKMLKIVEEPPENVLMLFCTTNPERMIDTLKNRCQLQLHVTKPKVKELAGLLKHVCTSEGVDYDMQGLEFIANRGELTIRTALTNLQQVVTEQNSAKYDNAIQVFDAVSSTIIINFFRALKNKDVFRYITILHEIKTKMDLNIFVNELKGFVLRGIYTINGIQQDGVSDNELVVYRDLFGDLGVAKISYLLSRVLSLSEKNLELELTMLGYTGLDSQVVQQEESIFNQELVPIEGELAKEVSMTNKVIKEQTQQSYEQGVANAEKFAQSASIDLILSMGGELVE